MLKILLSTLIGIVSASSAFALNEKTIYISFDGSNRPILGKESIYWPQESHFYRINPATESVADQLEGLVKAGGAHYECFGKISGNAVFSLRACEAFNPR